MKSRLPLPPQTSDERIVAVLRSPGRPDWAPIVDVLVEESISSIELTLTSPSALDDIVALRDRFGSAVTLGVGSVIDSADAARALDAGAEFIVTPAVVPAALVAAVHRRVPFLGGASSPTEILHTWTAGASAVKIFPASLTGPQYLRELRGPFPDLLAMPSGGVGVDDVAEWLRAGAAAVSLGGALVGNGLQVDLSALRQRARAARRQVEETR